MNVAAPFFLLLLLAVIAVGVWVVIVARRARRSRPSDGPICGACGYSVVGLTTMTCPECGGDLRSAGIVTPQSQRHTASWIASAALFSVLLALVVAVVTPTLFSVMPLRRSYEKTLRLLSPASGAYREVTLRVRDQTWSTDRALLPVQIELVPNPPATAPASASPTPPPPARLWLRPGGGYEFSAPGASTPSVAQQQGFGPGAVISWMSAAGINTSLPAVRHEAAYITGEARMLARAARPGLSGLHAGGFSSSSSGGGSSDPFAANSSTETGERRPPAWAAFPIALFWLAIWISGLRYLSRTTPARRAV
jgi:hypothetical protein